MLFRLLLVFFSFFFVKGDLLVYSINDKSAKYKNFLLYIIIYILLYIINSYIYIASVENKKNKE